MGALAWLAMPFAALMVALAWAAWVSRPRAPADPLDSVESYRRFTAALDRTRGGATAPPSTERRGQSRGRRPRRSGRVPAAAGPSGPVPGAAEPGGPLRRPAVPVLPAPPAVPVLPAPPAPDGR